MKFIILLFSIFFIISCSNPESYFPTNKESLADEIIEKTAKKIKDKYGLLPCGTGGQMMGKIKMLSLAFSCHQPVTIDSGRQLLVSAVQEFVSEINADERIRPFLDEFPFRSENVEIRIFIENYDGSLINRNEICVMTALKGVLNYEMKESYSKCLKTIYKENYEEALQKLDYSMQKSSLVGTQPTF